MTPDRRALLAGLAALSLSGRASAGTPASGRLVEIEALASAHVGPRNVSIWLPPGYDEQPGRRWPVLYMHDGQNLFDASKAYAGEWGVDEHITRLDVTNQIDTPIVVGIWNTPLRLREYIPADLIAALPDDMRSEIQGLYGGAPLSDAYLRFLVEELKPTIDRDYRTRPECHCTTIIGSSMGGLISLYALMKYPGVFGRAGCLSTHWPLRIVAIENPTALAAWRDRLTTAWARVIAAGLPDPSEHRLYFDRGDETLDAFYAEFQSRIDRTVRDAGWSADRFRSLVFPGAQHNEASWNQRLDAPLTFLLPPVRS